jgi:outer membrane protein assembly factor BamD
MLRKIVACYALACCVLLAGCNHKVQNPMAGIDSKQPDKTLFDRAMESMKKGRFMEARTLLETLINAYPESEYIARAKLAMGDSWYTEGGSAAWKQAELQYIDFQTFFPNMPEAAEAQLKVATIHYRQMEKPDRDFTEAMRANEEYKNLIQRYPDSSLVPEAKQRLREVQEVLAERQYRIAHFYYLRENLAAAQARLQSLTVSYPLYSGVDQALFELGSLYEKEANAVNRQNLADPIKEKLVANFQKQAVDAYSRIITRYPAMGRAGDARKRLEALNAPVPVPTAEAIAESKAEEQSRGSISMFKRVRNNFSKHPDVARSPQTGEPPLSEESVANPAAFVQDLTKQITEAAAATNNQKLTLEPVSGGSGDPPPNQPPPGSSSSSQPPAANNATPAQPPAGAVANPTGSPLGGNATSTTEGAPPSPAPSQINEVKKDSAQGQASAQGTQNGQAGSTQSKQDSSSKKKKSKKGLHKLIPI